MDEKEIRKYAGLMKELGLTGLEIKEKEKSIRLEMGGTPVQIAPAIVSGEEAAPEMTKGDNFENITSPMVGIFYAAPAENEDPYVKVGDKVKKGDTLCIIEAMKLMNEITSEVDGTIEEICVSNGATVEFGTVLFKIG